MAVISLASFSVCKSDISSAKRIGVRGVARTWATQAWSVIRDTLIEQSDRDKSVSVFREAV